MSSWVNSNHSKLVQNLWICPLSSIGRFGQTNQITNGNQNVSLNLTAYSHYHKAFFQILILKLKPENNEVTNNETY